MVWRAEPLTIYADGLQRPGLYTRLVDAGYLPRYFAGRRGRATNSPRQKGHLPPSLPSAHDAQNVASKEQMRAFADPGGRSLSQHSQPGAYLSIRISSCKECRGEAHPYHQLWCCGVSRHASPA